MTSKQDARVDQIVSLLADNPEALDTLILVARRLTAVHPIDTDTDMSLGIELYRFVIRQLDEIRGDLVRLTARNRDALDQRDLLWSALTEIHKTVQGIPSDNPVRVRHDLGNVLQVCQIAVDGSLPPFRSQAELQARAERDAAVTELQALRVRHGKLLAAMAMAQAVLQVPPESV